MPKHKHINALIIIIAALLWLGGCAKNKDSIVLEEGGMFSQKIRISSQPTKAKIYINEKEIGETPLTYRISHEQRRMLNIKAVPIFPNQYTQNIFLMVPPIPKTLTIYMNHYPEDYERDKDTPFNPPAKPLPDVIVKTERDTVYVVQHTKETEILSLPIIFFDTDSYALGITEEPKLKPLIEMLNTNQDLLLEIYGFADKRASEKHNLQLTLNRANVVKDYLIKNGINPARLSAFGHGKIAQVSSEGVAMDLSQSRKVLFLIKKPE